MPVRRALTSLAKAYTVKLEQRPVLTKTVTAVGIACAGDYACQKLEDIPWDWKRTFRMGIYTAAITPAVHLWYSFLMRRFTSPLHRMLADQLIWAPPGLVLFLYSMGAMEKDSSYGVSKVKHSFWPVMATNWMTWPAFQYGNFRFVPPQYQVLAVNLASFFWSMYISRMANKKTHHHKQDEAIQPAGN